MGVPTDRTLSGVLKNLRDEVDLLKRRTRSMGTRTSTTASRPSASSMGVGAMIYDADIHKPLWSDGTAWRDAAGTLA